MTSSTCKRIDLKTIKTTEAELSKNKLVYNIYIIMQ